MTSIIEREAEDVGEGEIATVFGIIVGGIGAILTGAGAYLLWNLGGALLVGGGCLIVIALAVIIRSGIDRLDERRHPTQQGIA